MALKLDDLIGKKKEVAQVLDLSKATANNAEEFKKLMEKVPEFKIKPEKVHTYEAFLLPRIIAFGLLGQCNIIIYYIIWEGGRGVMP